MSENKEIREDIKQESKRLRWIDAARGFIMFYLVITIVFPEEWTVRTGNPLQVILWFLFDHADTRATYMTLFDVGAASFIFILGFMMSVSFYKRSEKNGKSEALKHLLVRYFILFILGILIANLDFEFYEEKGIFIIIQWDVVISIATAGLVTIPFIYIRDPKMRIIAGYLWLLIYQILMLIPFGGYVSEYGNYYFKEYAINSVHGGIFGSIFGYAGISIIASALGDYIFFTKTEEDKKYRNLIIFGVINAVVGILVGAYVPGWEAAKRQVSFTHGLISIGITVIGLWVFSVLDRKYDKDMSYLRAYGMNPFFVYFIVELPVALLKETGVLDIELIGNSTWPIEILLTIIILIYTSVIMVKLYKEKKVISTEKAAIMFLVTAIVLVVLILILQEFIPGLDLL